MKLIVYGLGSKYQPSKFKPVKNREYPDIKPDGGLWSSPVNSKWGWADWCKVENYGDLSTSFVVQIKGNILVIDSEEDARALPWCNGEYRAWIDFEELAKHYDAIHLTVRGERATRFSREHSLYGWDCETVLVMNPNIITA